jgi:hypothetical protein
MGILGVRTGAMLSMRFVLLHSSLLWNFNKRLDPISRLVLPSLSLATSGVR